MRAAAAFVLLAASVSAAAGCASTDPIHPDRPEAVRPEGLDAMRGDLADRRQATRDLMDTNLIRPAAPSPAAETGRSVLGFLGDAANATLDVLALRAFGLW